MKIIIDEKICEKYDLTLAEAAMAIAVKLNQHENYTVTLANLEDRGVVVYTPESDDYKISSEWSDAVDGLMGGLNDEERLLNLAKKLREVFPAGRQQRIGSPYYYRCNTKEVVAKLQKFFEVYGQYSDDEILDAAKRYVSSFNGNYANMRLVKYFILKDDPRMGEDGKAHVVQISELATILENKEAVIDENWLMGVRN